MTTLTLPSPQRGKTRSPTRASFHQHRVLIYATCYNVLDGVTLTIRKLEHEILAAGHHVCILTTRSGNAAHTDLVGSHPNREVIFMDNAYPIPFLHDPKRPELTYQIGLAISSSVLRKLDDFEPTIVHMTVPDCTSLHIIQYARTKEIPIIATYHSNIPEYMEHYPGLSFMKHIVASFFRHQYNFVQALYVPTPYIVKHLIDAYKMEACTKMEVWGRGVDIQQFSPSHRSAKFRLSLGIAEDTCVVLWVGRLVPEKRPDIFAAVVRRLHEQGLKFHALVVGIGPCEREICELPNTSFLGWMSGEQLSVAYASSDVFLFPSAVETFGNVTLEAASSGLPVIVEAGCSGHLVLEGKNGYKVEEGDMEAFYEATLSLVQDKMLRVKFGQSSRELAVSLEKSAVVRKMLDNYAHITEEFYTVYGGHHVNRDAVYTKPDSFLYGRYPRPSILVFVESVFMVLFRVMWNMAVMFTLLLDSLSRPISRPSREQQFSDSPKSVVLSSVGTASVIGNNEADPLLCSESGEKGGVSMCDIELGEVTTLCEEQRKDDATPITISTEGDTSSSHGSTITIGDWKVSHSAAIAFLKIVQYQCLLESYCRATVAKRSTQLLQGVYPRRKNSSDHIAADDDDDEISVNRSRFPESRLMQLSQPPPSLGLQDLRVLRRNQNLAPELVV